MTWVDFGFVAERYNYWIFITLMMIGLYVVISRGNLVKKIVGLNLFQTSVFIYYISIGKISGGTAPVLIGDYGGHHDEAYEDAGHDAGLHGDLETNAPIERSDGPLPGVEGRPEQEGLHAAPDANAALAAPLGETGPAFEIDADQVGAPAADAVHQAADVIYTNPLPHVLILTAIVVGVATTAVGLALAVRIREAYGTIEEDELESADKIAEFGHDAAEVGGRA